jgi:hypothetical protein
VPVYSIGYDYEPYELWGIMWPGLFVVSFVDDDNPDGIGQGQRSDTFTFESIYAPGPVEFELWDDGESSSERVLSSLTAPGNHGAENPVPEPATLLLLGSGLLGLAGYRIRGKKAKK